MAEFRVRKGKLISTSITVPGDKSISHRSVMLGALSDGTCVINGFLASEDCLATMKAFRQMGVRIDVPDEALLHGPEKPGSIQIVVHGTKGKLTPPAERIDCGNSGTTMRLMSGLLAAQPFSSELFGDASLSRRPMKRVMAPLAEMGAKITAKGENGACPLVIEGGKLKPIHYTLPVASAQVKSAVLLAGLFCEGKTTVTEPTATRDHTERMLNYFGVHLRREGNDISVHGGQLPKARDFLVPGDISSAAFWLVAAAAQPGSELRILNVGLNKTRTGILKVLARMGAQVQEIDETDGSGEPAGQIIVRGTRLKGTTISGAEIANVIDELPVLAVAGALAEGKTVIKDAQELRVKETDRIAAVVHHLKAMGAKVTDFPDGMEIEGGVPLKAPSEPLPSYGDHRITMAFAIAGLFAEGETVLKDVECVDTSYPGFAKQLKYFQTREASEGVDVPVITRLPGSVTGPLRINGGTTGTVISIDGPAASGKSSVARALAERLGFVHVNSGAIYRAVTWAALQKGLSPADEAAVTAWLPECRITCGIENGHGTLRVGGEDPGLALSDPKVNAAVSAIAKIPAVREFLVPLQRDYAKDANIVMEGRDIGSVIFADTPWKYFITADEDVRQQRREAQGFQDSVKDRDKKDSSREIAPLTQPEGAKVIDTTHLNIAGVVDAIVDDLRKRGLVR